MLDSSVLEKDLSDIAAAAENCGLNFFEIDFLICRPEMISFVGAYSIPTRFAHWGFGKRFKRLMLQHRHGLARIHELVYFSDPCQAFLLENNSRVENMLVGAHVMAHSDFFKNNVNFARTRRDAAQLMASNNLFIQKCIRQYGLEAVEQVLDAAIALQHNIDLLLFIAINSTVLEDWQRKIIEIVREESCYFWPLQQTRLLNEGWAAYWHTRILQQMDLGEKEAVEFAIINAGALETDSRALNPYRLGVDIFKEIATRAGDQELFQIRSQESDITFIEKYLSEAMLEQLGLAAYNYRNGHVRQLEASPGKVKACLLRNLDNGGFPRISVVGERTSGGGLWLEHGFDGRQLDLYKAGKTLEEVYRLWGGSSISLFTQDQDREVILEFDGLTHSTRVL